MGGGEGNDTFNGDGTGNAGFDTVTYGTPFTGHATSGGMSVTVNRAVEVTFDDSANDCDGFGATTENVNGDINRLIGSPLADSLSGAGADQDVQLFGRLGDDLLTDGPFNDLLNGEGGTDTANCRRHQRLGQQRARHRLLGDNGPRHRPPRASDCPGWPADAPGSCASSPG